mmetsp:Transcript_18502/g.31605  ORF Transcript_18502/g.31605 Transcript_18502/m.31605 type:complete len:91 (+) Transcript_18502:37-309(+)
MSDKTNMGYIEVVSDVEIEGKKESCRLDDFSELLNCQSQENIWCNMFPSHKELLLVVCSPSRDRPDFGFAVHRLILAFVRSTCCREAKTH